MGADLELEKKIGKLQKSHHHLDITHFTAAMSAS